MSDPTEDLDALFEEMAAQHRSENSSLDKAILQDIAQKKTGGPR